MSLVRKGIAVGLAVVAVLSSTSAGQADQQGSANRITWKNCTDAEFQRMQCGTMQVPIDWANPRAGQLSLAMVKRPADERRQGTFMLNVGPGASTIEQLRLAMSIDFPSFAGDLTKKFDIVALDPRGIGHSTPIRCTQPVKPAGISYFPRDRAAFDALVAHNRSLGQDCLRRNGSLVTKVDMTSTARDFEAARIGLGAKQLDWYGTRYSALLGRTYAALFPNRLRTMVVDTAVDDTGSQISRIVQEMDAAEESFNRFAAWCASSADCALRGRDVAAEYDALIARADRTPIAVGGDGARSLTGEDIRLATQDYLNLSSVTWPELGEAIVKAQAGDAAYFTRTPDGTQLDPVQALAPACLDTPRSTTTYEEFAGLQRLVAQKSPHLGGAVRSWKAFAGCLGWPVPANPVDAGGPVAGGPKTLVTQSTHQALAPYAAGFAFAAQLPGSVVLTRDGDDYSMFLASQCVRDATNRYLTERVLPAPGTVCTD
ncbi:alpha/beta fold hydrolase [Lentzea sp. NPDC051213]|uniref:alpha/beta fold hydrolase n=1 Tax=Lentzea sp. NPDC051213 TaxID=3364126 RepID=UPI0037B307C4